ncbi:MAG: serine/threonine protein kinase [Deltaproteobacteria bacterium]|nr:serine/threonine protein kinase [Deltaproteobacteria bacterium]
MGEQEWVPGRVIADRYALQSVLGRGGMAVVWRAEHTRLRSPVAVKLLGDAVAGQPDAVPRFLREAQACAAIRGANVVQVLDFGVEEGTPYIAMELLEGETLRERLERVGRLTASETLGVVEPVAKAIARAHKRGIVHRDLKPGNIHLCRPDDDEDGEIVKVLDFGIAKILEGASVGQLTMTGQLLGTVGYMSPEQARGRMDLDHRSDLWSLGVIAYQCLVGALPYPEGNAIELRLAICAGPIPVPSEVAPGLRLPEAFDAWFARATRRSPDERFQSAAEMAEGLRSAIVGSAGAE